MWENEILEELHKIREERAKAFNYDIHAMCEDLRRRQAASGRKFISAPLKPRPKDRQDKNLQPPL